MATTTTALTKELTSPLTKTAPITTPVTTNSTTSEAAAISILSQSTTAAVATVTTASPFTTNSVPTTVELISSSCFPSNWPIFVDKTLVKLNVLDRTKCRGICQRIPECLAFATESRSCILKLSDNLENLQSASGILNFLRRNFNNLSYQWRIKN